MEWLKEIAVFMVVAGLLLEMIAETKYYRFAKWVSGIVLMVLFIKPFVKSEDIREKFFLFVKSFDYGMDSGKILDRIYEVEETEGERIVEVYKKTMEEQIDRILIQYGVKLISLEPEIAQNGTILGLAVYGEYITEEVQGTQIVIEKIKQIGETKESKQETRSPLELAIRDYLASFYCLDVNNVEVEIREV